LSSRSVTRHAASSVGGVAARVAARLRPDAALRAPAERSVLDDIAARRPWNLVVKAARLRARRRLPSLEPGVTVVIVSYNTRDVTADTLSAVQRRSPAGTDVVVVDNGSTDGSREMLRTWPGIRTLLLRSNAGHGVALDLGMCCVRTTVALALDSDAIPISDEWLEPACRPVLAGEAALAGLRSRRGYVHPVYAAIDVRTFLEAQLSFQVHRSGDAVKGAEDWGTNAWDTGELLTSGVDPAQVVFVERTENSANDLPGMTVAAVVYHHGGVSRESTGRITESALAGWRSACHAIGALTVTEGAR